MKNKCLGCRLRRASVVFFTLAVLIVGIDLVLPLYQIPTPNWHMPFMFAAGLAFLGFVFRAMSISHGGGVAMPEDGYDRSSYLHPDNHPKGRRDAPDGTSD